MRPASPSNFSRQAFQLSCLLSHPSLHGLQLLVLTTKEVVELVGAEILLAEGLPEAWFLLFLSGGVIVYLIGKKGKRGLGIRQLNHSKDLSVEGRPRIG